jgi:hypothetical protein
MTKESFELSAPPDSKKTTDINDVLEPSYALVEMQHQIEGKKEFSSQTKKVDNDFFNEVNKLFAQNLALDALKNELSLLAITHGFNNTKEALNQVENSDGQTLLLQAFQNQDFRKAKKLIDEGAEVGPIEKAAFEIALDSDRAKAAGLTMPEKKIEEGVERGKEIHPVKNFGLVLGIEMTSADGTYSQMADIAPAYDIMTRSVEQYSGKGNENFKEISEAFRFTNDVAKFSYSTSQNDPKAGEELAKRIQDGKVTSIPASFRGHCMGLSVVPDGPGSNSGYMVFTNRGLGHNPPPGTQIYRIDDLKKVDAEFINTMMNAHSKGMSCDEVMDRIKEVTGNEPPTETIVQKAQKYDNCTIANPRSNIEGILLCQKAIDRKGFENLTEQDRKDVHDDYKRFTSDMRAEKVNELLSEITKKPDDPDLNNIAKEYLKQHSDKIDPVVKGKLEKVVEQHDVSLDDQVQMSAPL